MNSTRRIHSIIALVLLQTFVHYSLHLGVPLIIALVFFRTNWKRAYILMLATMLVDLDHLLASPIFQPNRCSISFHPLHSGLAIIFYILLIFFKMPYRVIGVGLLFHMITDLIDCLFMFEQCRSCHEGTPLYDLWRML